MNRDWLSIHTANAAAEFVVLRFEDEPEAKRAMAALEERTGPLPDKTLPARVYLALRVAVRTSPIRSLMRLVIMARLHHPSVASGSTQAVQPSGET